MGRFEKGSWALVTGASSGLGEVFARKLGERGQNLILVARREDRLQKLAQEIAAASPVTVKVLAKDLENPRAVGEIAAFIDAQGLQVDTLINNAGYGLHGPFLEAVPDQELRMIDLNCRSLVALTHVYSRKMKARGRGMILHTSSVGGFAPCPYMTTYGATKAFILFFSEALTEELRPHGITVVALCPGYTRTGFQEAAGFSGDVPTFVMEDADVVVERGLAGLESGSPVVVSGLHNKLAVWLINLVPRGIVAWLSALILKPR